jgi:Outer membrane protein beta-barrel domain
MNAMKSFGLVPCIAVLSATVAFAQAQEDPRFQHGYMTAAVGTSFGDQQEALFGAEVGENLNRNVQAYANFTYFDNLITDSAQSYLSNLSATLTRLTATSWNLTGYDRGLAFSGGAKYVMLSGSTVRPYVGAGPGLINIRRTIYETDRGEISNEVLAVFGAPDGGINPEKEGSFKPMVEFLAGVGFAAGRTYVDVGYRFNKIYKTTEPLSFSQFKVGVGMRF